MRKADYYDLDVGDAFEAGPLLQGLSAEGMVWKVYSVSTEGEQRSVEFDVFWMGMQIGALRTHWGSGKIIAGDLK